MKKILAAAAIALMTLTACGGDSEPTPRETVYVQQESPAASSLSVRDQRFADAVRRETSADGNDKGIVEGAKAICESLDDTPTLSNVESWVEAGTGAGFSVNDSIVIVGMSIGAYCPEHSNLTEQFDAKYSGSTT